MSQPVRDWGEPGRICCRCGLPRAAGWFFWLLVAAVATIFAATIASRILVNSGMIAFRNGLLESPRLLSAQFPFYGHLRASQAAEQARTLLDQAAWLAAGDDTVEWAGARFDLATGDASRAVLALQPMTERIEADPLVYEAWLVGLSLTGQAAEAQRWYGATGSAWHTRTMSDTLALTCLDTARPFVEENDRHAAAPFLLQALRFRPADLYANWWLGRWADEDGDVQIAADYRRRLKWFPKEAIAPTNERLLEYVAEAIPALLEARVWDQDETVRVVSFLIWQAPEANAINRLLETLEVQYPAETTWPQWLDEMNRRRAGIRATPQPAFDDQKLLADLFGTASADFTPDPNLVPQGDFERYIGGRPQGWAVADYTTGGTTTESSGTFVAGVDPLNAARGDLAARLDGLWTRDGAKPGVFGLVTQDQGHYGSYAVAVLPQQAYLVSGSYRTRGSTEYVSIYLGNPQIGLLDEPLPATSGDWRRFVFTGCHTDASVQQMQLLLRVWGTGSVWFDDISVRRVDFTDRFDSCRRSPAMP